MLIPELHEQVLFWCVLCKVLYFLDITGKRGVKAQRLLYLQLSYLTLQIPGVNFLTVDKKNHIALRACEPTGIASLHREYTAQSEKPSWLVNRV